VSLSSETLSINEKSLLSKIYKIDSRTGASPPAHSIISDYFPPEKRATALFLYSTGIYLGIIIGFILGGFLSSDYVWRKTLIILGLPASPTPTPVLAKNNYK